MSPHTFYHVGTLARQLGNEGTLERACFRFIPLFLEYVGMHCPIRGPVLGVLGMKFFFVGFNSHGRWY